MRRLAREPSRLVAVALGAAVLLWGAAAPAFSALPDNRACFRITPWPVVAGVVESVQWSCARVTGSVRVAFNWGDGAAGFETTNNATNATNKTWAASAVVNVWQGLDVGVDGTWDSELLVRVDVVPTTGYPVALASPVPLPVTVTPTPLPVSGGNGDAGAAAVEVSGLRGEIGLALGLMLFLTAVHVVRSFGRRDG